MTDYLRVHSSSPAQAIPEAGVQSVTVTPNPVVEATPAPVELDPATVRILVLNGSGKTGEAKVMQEYLGDLGVYAPAGDVARPYRAQLGGVVFGVTSLLGLRLPEAVRRLRTAARARSAVARSKAISVGCTSRPKLTLTLS